MAPQGAGLELTAVRPLCSTRSIHRLDLLRGLDTKYPEYLALLQ